MSKDLFSTGELTLSRKETYGTSKQISSEPAFTSRMEKRVYYKSANHFDIRNVLDLNGFFKDIRGNWHTYVSQVNQWIQKNPVKSLVVTGIFTIVFGVFASTGSASFIPEYTYQVKSGEKIEKIATDHGVTPQDILEANGISAIEGKKILLPKVQDRTVNATILNVRLQPSTESSIIGKLKKGDIVKVAYIENGWAAILKQGQVCFVSANYLSEKKEISSSTDQTASKKTMYVTASKLKVRSAATTNSAELGSLKLNDRVLVKSISEGWAQINFNGIVAFVSETYLTIKEPTKTGLTEYMIKKGDTFEKIGKELGLSASLIQELNQTVEPTKLKIGQKIKVPATTISDTIQIKVDALLGGVDSEGNFRFITSDGKTYTAKASHNIIEELFDRQGEKVTLTLEGKRCQQMTLTSFKEIV